LLPPLLPYTTLFRSDRAGIGLTLLPTYYRWSNFAGADPVPAQRRFLNDPDQFAWLLEASARAIEPLPSAVFGVAPHSLRAVTPEDRKSTRLNSSHVK